MAGKKIGLVLALDGEKEFKSAIKAVKEEVKLYGDSIKNLDTAFANNKNSAEALSKKHEALSKKQEAYIKQLDAAKSGLDNAKEQYNKQAEALDNLKEKLDKAKDELKKMADAGDTSSEAYKKQKDKVDELTNAVSDQSEKLNTAQTRVNSWTREVNNSESALNKCNGELKENDKYLDEAKNSADGCATSIDNFGDKVKGAADETGKFNISLGDMIKNKLVDLAGDALRNLGEKAVDAAKYVIDVGSSFEAQMSKVEAISGASESDMSMLTKVASEMGRTTKFSATEAGEGLEYMAVAGWSASDMAKGLPGILNLAAASGEELGTTSDIVTDALTAFGASAEDSGRLADIMAAASSNANTNVSLMGETFKYAAPVAGALGYSMEDTAEAVGLMANAGIKGSQAGTSLRSIITRLSTDAGASSKSLGALGTLTEKLGVEFFNADGTARDLSDVLTEARAVWGGLTEEEQINYANTIAGKNAMSGWLALMNASPTDVGKLETALANCDGTAAAMAATMNDNLNGKITIMNSALEGLGIAVYGYVSGPLQGIVSGVTDIIGGITNVISPQKTELESFIEDVGKSNEAVEKSIENANATIANAEAEVAGMESAKTFLEGVLDNCKQFSETDLSGAASGIDSSLDTAETAFTDLDTAAGDATKSVEDINDVALDGSNLNDTAITDPLEDIGDAADDTKEAVEGVDDAALDGSSLNESALTTPLEEIGTTADDTKEAVEGVDDAALDGRGLNESSITTPLENIGESADTAKEAVEGVDDASLDGSQINESALTTPLEEIGTTADNVKESVEGVDDAALDGSGLNESALTTPLETIGATADDTKKAVEGVDDTTLDGSKLNESTLTTPLETIETVAGETKTAVEGVDDTVLDGSGINESSITTPLGNIETEAGKAKQSVEGVDDAKLSGENLNESAITTPLENIETKAGEAGTAISGVGDSTISTSNVEEGTNTIVTDMGEAASAAESATEAIKKPGNIKPTTISSNIKTATETIVEAEEEVKTGAEEANTAIGNIGSDTDSINDATTALGYMKDATGDVVVVTDEFTKSRITTVVNNLKDTVPELAAAWNETTGELSLTNEELLKYIQNAENTIKAKAYTEALSTAWKAVADSELSEAMALSASKAAHEDYERAMANGTELLTQYGSEVAGVAASCDREREAVEDADEAVKEAQNNTSAAKEIVAQMTGALEDMGAKVDGTTVSFESFDEKVEESNTTVEQSIDKKELLYNAFSELSDAIEDTEEATGALTDKQKESVQAFQEMADATVNDLVEMADQMGMTAGEFADWCQEQVDGIEQLQKDYDSLLSSVTDALKGYVQQLDTSGEEGSSAIDNMVTHLQEKTTSLQTWVENMKELGAMAGDGLPQSLYDHLLAEGPDKTMEAVQALVDAARTGDESFAQVADEWNKSLTLEAEAAVLVSYSQTGKDYAAAVAAGFIGTEAEYNQTVQDLVNSGAISAKSATDGYTEAGAAGGQNVAGGMSSEEGTVSAAAESVAVAGKTAIEKSGQWFKAAGQAAVNAFRLGMLEQSKAGANPTKQAEDIAQKSAESAKKTSETKFKESGKAATDSYANAIKSSFESSVAQAKSLAEKAGEQARSTSENKFRESGKAAIDAYASAISNNKHLSTAQALAAATDAGEAIDKRRYMFTGAGEAAIQAFGSGIGNNKHISTAHALGAATDAGEAIDKRRYMFTGAGESAVQAFGSGIGNNKHLATAQALAAATDAGSAVDKRRYMFTGAGTEAINAFARGISGSASNASGAAGSASSSAAYSARGYYSSFYYAGSYVIDGFASGIDAYSYKAAYAAARAAANALASAKAQLGVASPSKEFKKIGRFVDEGFAEGIERNQKLIEDAAAKASKSTIDAAKKMNITSKLDIIGAEKLNQLTNISAETSDSVRAMRQLSNGLKVMSGLAESLSNPKSPNVTVMIGNREFKGYIVTTAAEGLGQQQRNLMRGVGA